MTLQAKVSDPWLVSQRIRHSAKGKRVQSRDAETTGSPYRPVSTKGIAAGLKDTSPYEDTFCSLAQKGAW
jgi:hypothetical protein